MESGLQVRLKAGVNPRRLAGTTTRATGLQRVNV